MKDRTTTKEDLAYKKQAGYKYTAKAKVESTMICR